MRPEVDYLRVPEVAEALGITENAVRERIRRGKLSAFKNGREWRVAAADLLQGAGVSRALSVYLCQRLAERVASRTAEMLEKKSWAVVEQRLDMALAREAEANRMLGAALERARVLEAALEATRAEVAAFRKLHALEFAPGTVVSLEGGRMVVRAVGEIPPGP